MYCTPCARLTKSITPNTRVSPEAIRNSNTPSCSPLRTCTMRRVVFILLSFHRTILGVRIGIVLEDLLLDLGLELAVGALGHLHQVKVLDRVVVGVEPECATQRGELGLLQGGAQGRTVRRVALGQLEC